MVDKKVNKQSVELRIPKIRALVVDVDGTLTDGGMYYGANGIELKKFDTRDAKGMQLLEASGTLICVITGEDDAPTRARMEKLKVQCYYPGVANKLEVLNELIKEWDIAMSEVAFVGDDVNDLECIVAVGFSACPNDALPDIAARADYLCARRGGHGAVREVCELLLNNQR
jgi:YrbI family 3-deoxy-D-manno-octulosonate 8-phosphate phosphatase